MADENEVVQLWNISPNGGQPTQLTTCATDIQSAFTWHPTGKGISFICDNSVMIYDLEQASLHRLTLQTEQAPCAEAVVWSPDGKKIAFMRDIEGYRQLFVTETMERYWC